MFFWEHRADGKSYMSMPVMPVLKRGHLICGWWERNIYRVERVLGRGGTAHVYLVRDTRGALKAMKISPDRVGVTHEHRILRLLNQAEGGTKQSVVPQVYELDDVFIENTVYHYIITQFCPGTDLAKCLGRLAIPDVLAIGVQIARFLSCLHSSGFVYGDLKPGNVVYDPRAKTVHIVDYGSVSIKGNGLHQYTPGYDRASWQAGTRMADEKFDIFSLGMLLALLIMGKVSRRDNGGLAGLTARVSRRIRPGPLRHIILGAFRQDISDCLEIALKLELLMKETDDYFRTGLLLPVKNVPEP